MKVDIKNILLNFDVVKMTADRGSSTTFGVPQKPQKAKKVKHVVHWFRKGSILHHIHITYLSKILHFFT